MYSDLYDLISCLSRSTKLHIGVLFFGNRGNDKTVLPQKHKFHEAPVCAAMKSTPAGFSVCYRHRNEGVKRVHETGKPYHAVCPNGLFEYLHPVLMDGEVAALVFVGNICPQGREARLADSLGATLFDTVERDVDLAIATRYAQVVESYIRMLLEAYTDRTFAPLVENIKSYVAENAASRIDLAALATLFHYNEKYLGRLFKRQTGESLTVYINRQRVTNAARLLRKSNDAVCEVAAKTGFSSVNYFNRVFKGIYGVTPTAYREKQRK